MKVTAFLWYAFKIVVLPLGVIIGILMDTASLSDLSGFLTGSLLNFFDLLSSDNVALYSGIFRVLTAPVALLAWMMPEGSSVFILAAGILGQVAFYVVVTLLCWSIKPPALLMQTQESSEPQTA